MDQTASTPRPAALKLVKAVGDRATSSSEAGREPGGLRNLFLLALLVAALSWSWGPAEISRWTYLFTDSGNMAEYAAGFLRPNFNDWRHYLEEMLVTIQIAIWGTFLAVVFSIPFGI